MTPDATAIAIARLEERFDALEAGQAKILAALNTLRSSDTELRVRMAKMESDIERRPTFQQVMIGIVVGGSALIAVAELFILVVLK